ncbi:MAG: Crp/Fnr family transcriptional regulator [Hoeflea sp.]|uniref:Crp/Fnr family transcriptional regulator n=1 Tax=Hoeflea sp. TaxID=1940281 RepID=UPI001D4993E7|nr:Crp/Fnr family transcriptional regulator [Hoeflea sp.]MBU4527813.1 Crp/Fnr family transcriptional regulator [Alphaproteobacteria bacterium]MBU4546152.1 Crp/Fnr family transcriptional regulator [Alphaproteobacteria bacterium]MBU4553163.1 Crp/Fnr family transcriptional regulator [Alphaproteobacteria bacterium]MBV1724235.1 Crp/Fnr family transcriptional regulator [Hoeflea sp.]MBV1759920.1 Crp/Fnr family transcriptional regulator [Hoeflea sp.]
MDIQRKDVHNSDLPVLCQACESRHRGVCGALTPDQLLQLSKHSTRRTLEPGAELAGESIQTKTYSNIISGVVKLSKMMADGRQQIVGLQFAPDFLGRPFRKENGVSAEAATGVKVCSFPKQVIERMIGEMPELEHKLLEQTLDELDEARNWMLTLGRKTAGEKVASFLLLIATHAFPDNESDSVEFELPMSRMDIADFLGLTMETVSRQLTKLRADGVIRIINNRHVEVPDIARLSDRAGM